MRRLVLLAISAFIAALMLLSIGGAFRDNDQAALISGALQFTRGQMSPIHSLFYNYDKQWGSYLLLAGVSLVTPRVDPVLRGNVLQIALLLPAMLLALLTLYRAKRVPLWTFLPTFLCPALLLYAPFLATASLSLAFLFLTFSLARSGRAWARLPGVPIAIALAAACRGDVVLVVPAIVLSSLPRHKLTGLFRSKFAWWTALAAIAPPLIGRFLEAKAVSDLAGFAFIIPLLAAFLTWGLGWACVIVLVTVAVSRVLLVRRRAPWRFFYGLELFALLLPVGFYWSQLYSPRYFFLTLVALLFVGTNRRSARLLTRAAQKEGYRAATVRERVPLTVLALAIVPWVVGMSVPSLRSFRPTITQPTTFPTADGVFPMGAYLSFAVDEVRQHFLLDQNQRTWEAAKTVSFRTCNGVVPFIASPMSNYLDLAMRFQNKTSLRLTDVQNSPCGGAYLDLRAVIRRDAEGVYVPQSDLTIVSGRPELGRPIAWMEADRVPSPQTRTFQELAAYYHGKDAEIYVGRSLVEEAPLPGLRDTRFSFDAACTPLSGLPHLCAGENANRFDGWARTVFPPYIPR